MADDVLLKLLADGGPVAVDASEVLRSLTNIGVPIRSTRWRETIPTRYGNVSAVAAVALADGAQRIYLTGRGRPPDLVLVELLLEISKIRTVHDLQLVPIEIVGVDKPTMAVRMGSLRPEALITTLALCYTREGQRAHNASMFAQAASAVLQEEISVTPGSARHLAKIWRKYTEAIPVDDPIRGPLVMMMGYFIGESLIDGNQTLWEETGAGSWPIIRINGAVVSPFAIAGALVVHHASVEF